MVQSSKMEKAKELSAILRSFRLEPLRESDLAEFYFGDTMFIRTGDRWISPLRELYRSCTTPSRTNAHLLLGHRGCGKSTELISLKRQLENEGQPVFIVDCALQLDLFQSDCWDIMLLITEGLFEIAKSKKIKVPNDIIKAVLDYLKKDTEIMETEDSSISVEAGTGVKVSSPPILDWVLNAFISIKSDAKLSAGTRSIAREKLEKRTSEWLEYTKQIAAYVSEGCKGKQPVIIFESLDKLPIPGRIFEILQFTVLSEMPFPVIYTFPISQFYSLNFSTVRNLYIPHILPMIKISNLDRSSNKDGISAIKEIVSKRADLELFDSSDKIGVLEYLIIKTGGSLRHLFECITKAAQRADLRGADKMYPEDASSALSGLKGELTRQVVYQDYESLANIYKCEMYRTGIDDLDLLLRMTQSSVIIEYQNGERWHDLHPLISEFLERQGVV